MTTESGKKILSEAFRKVALSRRSAKRFIPNRPVDGVVLKDVMESSLRAPSSFNLQPTQIILVRSQKTKDMMASEAMLGIGNQYRTRDASAVAVFLADLEMGSRIDRIEKLEREDGARDPNYLNVLPMAASFLSGEGHAATFLKQTATSVLSNVQSMPTIEPVLSWSSKNTALVVQTFLLGLTSHGLASCVMEGFDARRLKEILRVPDRYAIPMVVATGYDYYEAEKKESGKKQSPLSPRLPLEEVVFEESFGEPLIDWTDDVGPDSGTAGTKTADESVADKAAV